MRHVTISLVGCILVAALAMAGCGQAAPPLTPTKPPAQPTAAPASQPTAAPVSQPTAVPAAKPTAAPPSKVVFPEAGKAITLIVPYGPGGTTDVAARVLAPPLEKELGASIQVVNRPGAGNQVGLTELSKSKPDGYTVGYVVLPTAFDSYLDPERKAAYTRKSFQPLANQYLTPIVMWVQANSPYRSMKDLIDAARANPEKIKAGATGVMGISHLAILQLEKAANVKFATVQFDGGGPAVTALLGGHVDAALSPVASGLPQVKGGQLRAVGVADSQETSFLPGVKTLEAQGYKVSISSAGALAVTAGTPPQVVDILSKAIKKAMESDDHKKKMGEMGVDIRYMDPAGFESFWSDYEAAVIPLLQLSKK